MDDHSPTPANGADKSPPADEKPTSMWKKELSLKRTPDADGVEGDAVAGTPSDDPTVEEPKAEEPVAEEPVTAEPQVADETVWKKEVSFGRKVSAEDKVVEAEPLSRAPEVEPVADQKRLVEEEPVAEEQPVVEEEPVATEGLVVDEEQMAVAELATKETAAVGEPVASLEVETPETWNAAPVLPPAPAAEVPEASVPAFVPADVHPPVAAAVLPQPVAEDSPKMPFWKKEISLGGKKRDKRASEVADASVSALVPSADVHPPVAASDEPQVAEDAPNVPFWKKELSFGSKKGDKPVKDRKQKAPKVKAERVPKTKEDKEPKEPKHPKERKQKTPKVKAERGNAKGRVIGLKIGASQLAAARVSNNGSAELLQVAREPLASGIIVGGELRDPDALSEALKDFFEKHGLPKKGVRLGIANNRIGVRTFEIAGIEDQKQLANAIRFRAQETLPIPIDEAVLDFQVLGEGVGEDGQPTKRVLLVVAYRELIDRYVGACKKAGITLVGIDLEAFALLRALQAPQDGTGTDASAALVVVAIGHERSTFAVSDGRVCEFTRVLEWGGSALNVAIARAVDAAPSEVEATKRALSLMDEMVPDGITADQAKTAREAMRKAIQTFARELVSSLQYYQNQPGSLGIGEIVLTGGTAHLPGLAGELERLIGVHVRVGDPLARMKVSKKVGQPEQIGSLAVAIGLGIED
jgi:type IV pilus assembly protein PilM